MKEIRKSDSPIPVNANRMRPNKRNILREQVRQKYNGLCAYTGKPLDDKWQIDHITPQYHWSWRQTWTKELDKNHIDNLMPTCRIINHYKRALNLEQFRAYMLRFHERLAKLPKKTTVPRTEARIAYLNKVAELFDIAPDKPFNGKFYFETI